MLFSSDAHKMDDKLYYTIGEVADLLATSTSQLRYWSGEFALNVRKNRKGDRLFQKNDVIKLKLIQKLLKDEGFTIEGAKKKIKSMTKYDFTEIEKEESNTESTHMQHQTAKEVLSRLLNIKVNLERLKVEIDQNF